MQTIECRFIMPGDDPENPTYWLELDRYNSAEKWEIHFQHGKDELPIGIAKAIGILDIEPWANRTATLLSGLGDTIAECIRTAGPATMTPTIWFRHPESNNNVINNEFMDALIAQCPQLINRVKTTISINNGIPGGVLGELGDIADDEIRTELKKRIISDTNTVGEDDEIIAFSFPYMDKYGRPDFTWDQIIRLIMDMLPSEQTIL